MMTPLFVVKILETGAFKKEAKLLMSAAAGTAVRFVFTPSLRDTNLSGVLFLTNYGCPEARLLLPLDPGRALSRAEIEAAYPCRQMTEKHNQFVLEMDFAVPGLFFAQLVVFRAGSDGSAGTYGLKQADWVIVHPALHLNPALAPKRASFDALNLMTLFPSMMGPVEEWEEELEYLVGRGYHAFHFSPIQSLGSSLSLYSVRDHLRPNPRLFGPDTDFARLRTVLRNVKSCHNVFFMVDIIWNHCSVDAEWLDQEPDGCYSVRTCPHLAAALAVDDLLARLTADFGTHSLIPAASPTQEWEIAKICDWVAQQLTGPVDLKAFFLVDEKVWARTVEDSVLQGRWTPGHDTLEPLKTDLLEMFQGMGSGRWAVTGDLPAMLRLLALRKVAPSVAAVVGLAAAKNAQMGARVDGWTTELVQNVREEMVWRFLRDPARRPLSPTNPLVSRQFHTLPCGTAVLLNGFVPNYASKTDFAEHPDQFYLRRKVVVWGDLVKLRYSDPDRAPRLWTRMRDYTRSMAELFDGFRLDNFHNSNMPAARRYLAEAFAANERLFVLSELFTPVPELDAHFVLQVGINHVVREVQNFHWPGDLVGFYRYYLSQSERSGVLMPAVTTKRGRPKAWLKPKMPNPLVYDQTHDNQTYAQRHHSGLQLPILCVENFLWLMVGTSRGFDEFFADHVSVTCQKRYPRVLPEVVRVETDSAPVLVATARDDLEGVDEVRSVALFGEFDDWKNGVEMRPTGLGDWTCRPTLKLGTWQVKFRVNGHQWVTSRSRPRVADGKGNFNNTLTVQTTREDHRNLVG